jgi:hypothetical protein
MLVARSAPLQLSCAALSAAFYLHEIAHVHLTCVVVNPLLSTHGAGLNLALSIASSSEAPSHLLKSGGAFLWGRVFGVAA